MQLKFFQIFIFTLTLTLHVMVIRDDDVNPGFSCQFVLQFPMIYCIRVVEVVE
jgi:hypothetical protein